jgi:flagellum-specific peptidoglycan hydrolase FlgJ
MASSAQQKQFINEIAYVIQEEAKARGYQVCSPIIAQACIESAYGTSSLGYRWHNYFGMKCGSSWKGKSINLSTKEEYQSGQLTTIRDNFRVYDSMEEGVKGYFDFISSSRYANLKNARTPKEYLEFIKRDGYATSSSYVNTNMSCIGRHDLERFDWNEIHENPYKLSKSVIQMGDKGESVKWMQWELNRHGASLKVDGIYGNQTKLSVLLFQKQNGLVADSIVGPKTIAALKN